MISAKPYTSQFLVQKSGSESVKMYYLEQIQRLSEAAPPQLIDYISSRNTKKYGKVLVRGVLFTYKNEGARRVLFASSIDNFVRYSMNRNEKGVWFYIFVLKPYQAQLHDREFKYRFIVDTIFVNDPNGYQKADSSGEYISVYNWGEHTFEPAFGVIPLKRKTTHTREFLFRVRIPNSSRVSLIGSFNHWNQDLDIMNEVADDIFELRKFLLHGEYIYLYRAEGEYHLDIYNHQKKSHNTYGKVSYLRVH